MILAGGEEWVRTAGSAGAGESLDPEHLIWIASTTKSMTGGVILGLAEAGVLGLDDPIPRWLGNKDNVDPKITIRQLLNHTNGLANYTRHPELGTAVNADSARVFTADELLAYVGPRSFERGARTQYTDTSFVLLGLIAEAATEEDRTKLGLIVLSAVALGCKPRAPTTPMPPHVSPPTGLRLQRPDQRQQQ